jgi:hypothetical protein
MSEAESTMHTEDIDLDESGAESVIGGAGIYKGDGASIHRSHLTMSQAVKADYQPIACERDGITLMRNIRTGKEILVR